MMAVVSAGWLARSIRASAVKVVDASWYLPAQKRDPRAEYQQKRIRNATFFDIDEVCDKTTPLPHMMPSPDQFERAMNGMGIGRNDHVVVYDGLGLISARCWWMLKAFGHEKCSVLDGGLPLFEKDHSDLMEYSPPSTPMPTEGYTAVLQRSLITSLPEVLEIAAGSGSAKLVDARPLGRFLGNDPEPRPGLRSGHIPNSVSLCFKDVMTPDQTMLPPEELRKKFDALSISDGDRIVTTCGSGVSAAVLFLALHEAGHDISSLSLYDGSWAEYGSIESNPRIPQDGAAS